MNEADKDDKARNRQIAENEAERQVVGDVRVSVWAIALTVIAGIVVCGIVWAWLHR